jgi:outer membrane biosynthesis protein TonB
MRFALLLEAMLALAVVASLGGQQKPASDCCQSKTEKLAAQRVKSMVLATEPIQLSGRAHIDSKVVLAITVDADGRVTCLQLVSGHPLLASSTIESVKRWKFRPYVTHGRSKNFCGRIALWIRANDEGVTYDVIEAPPN